MMAGRHCPRGWQRHGCLPCLCCPVCLCRCRQLQVVLCGLLLHCPLHWRRTCLYRHYVLILFDRRRETRYASYMRSHICLITGCRWRKNGFSLRLVPPHDDRCCPKYWPSLWPPRQSDRASHGGGPNPSKDPTTGRADKTSQCQRRPSPTQSQSRTPSPTTGSNRCCIPSHM